LTERPSRRAAPQPNVGEESLEELYEDAAVAFLTTAADGTILRANRTFLGWCGYGSEELAGRRLYDLLPPGTKIYYETHYAPLLQMQGHVREIALEVVRADGSRLPVLLNATMTPEAEGRPALVRVTLFDATERRRYERELLRARGEAEKRAAAATALMHVAEAVVLVDDDGVVRVLNPAAERLFAASAEEAVGLRLDALVPGWTALAERIPRGAGSSIMLPLAVRGATRWVAASAESPGEGVVFTLRDVTEERRLEDMRDDIVALVSHELRRRSPQAPGSRTRRGSRSST
jgi:PAS domain S-box-containing protein